MGVAALAAAALAAAAVAIAGEGGAPATEQASGTFALAPVKVKQRPCTGADGSYLEARGVLAGTSSSPDPRYGARIEVVIGARRPRATTTR